MTVSRLEDRAGTHISTLPLSVELQKASDSNGKHVELHVWGLVYNVNGRGVKRLLGIGWETKNEVAPVLDRVIRVACFKPFGQI